MATPEEFADRYATVTAASTAFARYERILAWISSALRLQRRLPGLSIYRPRHFVDPTYLVAN